MIATRATCIVLAVVAAALTCAQWRGHTATIRDAVRVAESPRPVSERDSTVGPIVGDDRSAKCEASGVGIPLERQSVSDAAVLVCDPFAKRCTPVTVDQADRKLRPIEKRPF